MLDMFEEERHILFLCNEARRPLYADSLSNVTTAVYYIDDAQAILNACIAHPPVMIILDQESLVTQNAQHISWVDRFDTSWPVLHADFDESQVPQIACQRPPHHAPLTEAITGILNEEEAWQTPGVSRSYIRLDCQLRAKYRPVNTDAWILGNAINVSSTGLFIVSYEQLAIGTDVEIQLFDLTEESLTLEAVVAWQRTWEQSNELPGIGLLLPAHEMGLWKAIRESRGRMLETHLNKISPQSD